MKKQTVKQLITLLLACLPLLGWAADNGTFTYEVVGTNVMITGLKDVNSTTTTNITIPSAIEGKPVTEIGERAFFRYTNLQTVSIPSSVETIGVGAFMECSALASVTIKGTNLKTIEDNAFNWCKMLPSVVIPSSVETIGAAAFWRCEALASVTIEGTGLKTIEELAFALCHKLPFIVIPSSVETIGELAFQACIALTCVRIKGTGLKTIGKNAFETCIKLPSIVVPSSVETIGQEAFWGCTALESVTFRADISRALGSNMFKNCSSLARINVPSGSGEAYKRALPSLAQYVYELPNPMPLFYGVSISPTEGVIIVRNNSEFDSYDADVMEGTAFAFSLHAKVGYDVANMVVTTSRGEVLTPRGEDGRYVIDKVSEDVEIIIKGVAPLANEEISHEGTAIYAADGQIYIEVPQSVTAYVYTSAGALKYNGTLSAGSNRIALSGSGIYFVRLSNGAVRKVVM